MNEHGKTSGNGHEAGRELMRRVKAHFALKDYTYTKWARAHGFSPQMVSWTLRSDARQGKLACAIRDALYRELGETSTAKQGGGK
jgi:hypothetical protein